jgi:hypothetical protein
MTPHRVVVWPWLRLLGSLVLRDWLAITLGHRIFAWRPMSEAELAHELEHVRQWARHGAWFGLVYVAAGLGAWRGGGHWYRDNPFEIAARKAARGTGPARASRRPERHSAGR